MREYQDHGLQSSSVRAPGVSYDREGNVIIEAVFPEPAEPPTAHPKILTLYLPLRRTPEEVKPHGLKAVAPSGAEAEPRTEGNATAALASPPSGAWVQQAVSGHIASTLEETRRAYHIIPAAVWTLSRKGRSAMRESARLVSTFAVIFSILFVSLNYQSFWQILRPYLKPEEEYARSLALRQIVDPVLQRKLQRIPSLPVAGVDLSDAASLDLAVNPPDMRIVIPKIGKNVPIQHPPSQALEREDWVAFDASIQDALKDGVVHYPGTARPGQRGNAFFTGHSSYYPWDDGRYKDVFARLPELAVNDEYVIYDHGRAHHYRVTNVFEVMPNDTSVLDQPADKQMSTLMTCVPIGTTLRRLIVQGEEFDPMTGEFILSETYADGRLPTGEVMLPI